MANYLVCPTCGFGSPVEDQGHSHGGTICPSCLVPAFYDEGKIIPFDFEMWCALTHEDRSKVIARVLSAFALGVFPREDPFRFIQPPKGVEPPLNVIFPKLTRITKTNNPTTLH